MRTKTISKKPGTMRLPEKTRSELRRIANGSAGGMTGAVVRIVETRRLRRLTIAKAFANHRVHEVKCYAPEFKAIVDGTKTHELRINDRDYRIGDVIREREYWPGIQHEEGSFTGRTVEVLVTNATRGGCFGLPQNMIVMSITLEEP